MKLRILSLAVRDLEAGRDFYERQQVGLGDYFLDTLFSDIEALLIHAWLHARHFGYFRSLSRRFPYAIYYKINWMTSKSGVFWTAGGSRHGSSRL